MDARSCATNERRFRPRLRCASLLALAALSAGCSTTTVVQTVAKVTVTPPADSLLVKGHVTLKASLTDDGGRGLKGPLVFWSTQDSAIATVSSSGVVTGVSPGRVQVAASADGVSGIANINVMAVRVTSIRVVPDTLRVTTGGSGQLIPTAYDGSGAAVPGLTFTWGSSTPAVATVDQSGKVTAVSVGTSTVTAAAAGLTGSAAVIVTLPPVASVTVVPDTLTIQPGAKGQLKATAFDASGHVINGLAVSWASSSSAVATVDGTGDVTGVVPGTVTISATIGGRAGTAKVTVAVPPPVMLSGCNGGTLTKTTVAAIIVTGNIDNQCTATLTSTAGSIEIRGNVDHASTAILVASEGIAIVNAIMGGSTVQATAGGPFSLGQDVGGNNGPTRSTLTVFNSQSLGLAGNFHMGAQGKLHSLGPITIAGSVRDPGTNILWWGPSFSVTGGVRAPATAVKDNWDNFPDQH